VFGWGKETNKRVNSKGRGQSGEKDTVYESYSLNKGNYDKSNHYPGIVDLIIIQVVKKIVC